MRSVGGGDGKRRRSGCASQQGDGAQFRSQTGPVCLPTLVLFDGPCQRLTSFPWRQRWCCIVVSDVFQLFPELVLTRSPVAKVTDVTVFAAVLFCRC